MDVQIFRAVLDDFVDPAEMSDEVEVVSPVLAVSNEERGVLSAP